jgi:hypothetical protein
MKLVLKNTQEKTFPETLEIPSMVANYVVGGDQNLDQGAKFCSIFKVLGLQ